MFDLTETHGNPWWHSLQLVSEFSRCSFLSLKINIKPHLEHQTHNVTSAKKYSKCNNQVLTGDGAVPEFLL